MDNWLKFTNIIIATVVLLLVGLVLPSNIAMILSVIFFAAVAWLKPKLLIPMLFIYFPFRPFLVEINDGLKLAGDIGIFVLVLRVLFDAVRRKDFKSIFQLQWFEWAYLLFNVVGAIAALITGVELVAIVFQLRKFLTMYLLFYGIKRLSWDKEDMFRILKLILRVAAVLTVHGFIEKLSQRQWLLPTAWKEQFVSPANADRIYGLLGNPNSMGLYMFVAVIASLILLQMTKKKIYYVPLVLSFGTFLLTFSRGSWLGAMIAFVAFFLLTRNWQLLKKFAIVVVAGFVLVYLPMVAGDKLVYNSLSAEDRANLVQGEGGIGDRLDVDSEEFDRTLNTGRMFFVRVGFQILQDYPIIGTGFGTFGDSAALVYSSPIYEDYGLNDIYYYMGKDFYSDNQYIQIIVQTGIIGTLLFALFLLNIGYRMWTMRKNYPETINVAILFWLFIGVVGIVYNVWENQVFPMIFFALLAWLETVRRGKSEPLVPRRENN
ncbi:O-antigen ligase family protein [Ornithinibacillus californiensis]|uniref:O-antigen ligase family protein n=1 Tax=Ornithinibacillus californiensis TaxID=161536 RepID=UPI00069CF650|nr:O-antigen ligase family protein [Ornithinibacillus californiensis]